MRGVVRMKLIVLGLSLMLAGSQAVLAATCAEGLIMLQNTVRHAGLTEDDMFKVEDLMFQAKVEYDQGNSKLCKYIVADIIRHYLLDKQPSEGVGR